MRTATRAAVALLLTSLCVPISAAALPAPELAPGQALEPDRSGCSDERSARLALRREAPALRREAPALTEMPAVAYSGTPATYRRSVSAAPSADGQARTAVPVYVHVLRSPSGPTVSRARVLEQFQVLNGAFAGRQSGKAATAPFRFERAAITRTTNRAWDHMTRGSRAERNAKRALHRGDADDLNLYIVAKTEGVLGWATQPQAYGNAPLMDGVVIARTTTPGGSRGRYSAGDAAVHESGHWLGLFHTFAGRCDPQGDRVADTPPEARPNYRCPVGRDTCTAPGNDPVHNFMDYSYDACMNQFTSGQVDRTTRIWQRFRAGGGSG